MEYCNGGELFDYIVSKQRLREREACWFYYDLVNGIEYVHTMNVCHRDLKPENLLLDSNKRIKIIDFGLSNTYKDAHDTLTTACGSPCYAAPEMIAGKRYKGKWVDVWSSGVVLYAMICGYLPFEDPETAKLYKKIMRADYEIPEWLSDAAVDMLAWVLNTNPDHRYDTDEIKSHPWFL